MRIFVTTQFEALHSWSDAPQSESFLRNSHRHQFKVRLQIQVTGDDREIEFFALKKKLDKTIEATINKNDAGSCEQIARRIIKGLGNIYFDLTGRKIVCEVSEDGENGAIVEVPDMEALC